MISKKYKLIRNNILLIVWIICLPFTFSKLNIIKTVQANDHAYWRVMPIRSEEEFNLGLIGGEAEQHNQGIARSLSDPNIIYLSHDCGQVWRSDNGGESWKKTLNINLTALAGQSIEVDPVNPDSVFVIMWHSWDHQNGGYDGLYHSNDGGRSWQFVKAITTTNSRHYEHNIAFDKASITTSGASRWYAAFHHGGSATDEGIYRSDDNGKTWKLVSSLSGHTERYYNIQTHPTDGNTVYVASNQGLFVSNERGANLRPLGNLPSGVVSSIAINSKNANVIYAVVKNNGLYKSTNSGISFTRLRSNPSATHVFINPGYPETVYFTGDDSSTASHLAVVSTDNGITWNTISLTPALGLRRWYKTRMGGNMTGVVPNPNNRREAVAYTRAAIWKTLNNINFKDSSTLFTGYACGNYNNGITFDTTNPNRFATFNADVGMAITFNGGDFFYRRGVPIDWRSGSPPKIDWTTMHAAAFKPGTNVIVSAAGYVFTKRLVRSSDSGQNWVLYGDKGNYETLERLNPKMNYWFIAFHPTETNLVFTENKRSRDGGITWEEISYLTERNASIIGVCHSRPGDEKEFFVLYAIRRPRTEIFRSFDKGDTWESYVTTSWQMNGHDSKPVIAIDPVNPNKIYTIDSNRDLAVYDGKIWKSLGLFNIAVDSKGPTNFPRAIAIDPRHPEIIYAGMHLSGSETVWRSVNSGATWENITYNLPRLQVGGFSINPHTGEVFKGGADGTYVYPPPYDEGKQLIYDKCVSLVSEKTSNSHIPPPYEARVLKIVP